MTKPRPVKTNSLEIPPYKKPYLDFAKRVKVGDKVSLKTRILVGSKYELKDISGAVIWTNVNSVWVSDQEYSTPFFAIHDWEIISA